MICGATFERQHGTCTRCQKPGKLIVQLHWPTIGFELCVRCAGIAKRDLARAERYNKTNPVIYQLGHSDEQAS